MHEGRRAKARRGELFFNLPRGCVRRPSGEIELDPDEQVQATVRLVFDVFERQRTVNGVLDSLVAHAVTLPRRTRSGPAKGEVEWHRPNRYTLTEMLANPAYAGAYAYGKRPVDGRRQAPGRPGSGRVRGGPGDTILLRDRWPAYITLGRPTRGTAPRWPRTGPSTPASPAAARRCWRAWSCAAGAGTGWRPSTRRAGATCATSVRATRSTTARRRA